MMQEEIFISEKKAIQKMNGMWLKIKELKQTQKNIFLL